jgi:hypothetical protein
MRSVPNRKMTRGAHEWIEMRMNLRHALSLDVSADELINRYCDAPPSPSAPERAAVAV